MDAPMAQSDGAADYGIEFLCFQRRASRYKEEPKKIVFINQNRNPRFLANDQNKSRNLAITGTKSGTHHEFGLLRICRGIQKFFLLGAC
jgi:hypothetical protein